MAKSKANNDKENFNDPQDDDDFGLPELDYEALGDDNDLTMDEEADSIFGDIPDDASMDSDPEAGSIFEIEDSNSETMSNVFGSAPPPPPPSGKGQVYYDASTNNEAKRFTRIIVLAVVLFVLAGFAFLWWHHKDDGKNVVAKATPKEKTEPKPMEPQVTEPVPAEEIPAESKATASKGTKPANTGAKKPSAQPSAQPGELITVTQRTGRSYVIVGSFFDGDLADDYGKKLSGEGVSATIIKPTGKAKFHKVSIADFDTYEQAEAEAERAKSTYGSEVWPLRY